MLNTTRFGGFLIIFSTALYAFPHRCPAWCDRILFNDAAQLDFMGDVLDEKILKETFLTVISFRSKDTSMEWWEDTSAQAITRYVR